jgi:tRNA(Arg) A34 adenosine deaminase TadA
VADRDAEFLRRAIDLALENVRANQGGPFAALVVRDGRILGEGTNLVTSTNDPTAHAEIVAIRRACAAVGSFQLDGCDLYATCEPCPMCLGAIYWARPQRVIFAATREDASLIGFDDSLIYREISAPLEERRLPMVQMLREEALAIFEEWRRKEDKIPY